MSDRRPSQGQDELLQQMYQILNDPNTSVAARSEWLQKYMEHKQGNFKEREHETLEIGRQNLHLQAQLQDLAETVRLQQMEAEEQENTANELRATVRALRERVENNDRVIATLEENVEFMTEDSVTRHENSEVLLERNHELEKQMEELKRVTESLEQMLDRQNSETARVRMELECSQREWEALASRHRRLQEAEGSRARDIMNEYDKLKRFIPKGVAIASGAEQAFNDLYGQMERGQTGLGDWEDYIAGMDLDDLPFAESASPRGRARGHLAQHHQQASTDDQATLAALEGQEDDMDNPRRRSGGMSMSPSPRRGSFDRTVNDTGKPSHLADLQDQTNNSELDSERFITTADLRRFISAFESACSTPSPTNKRISPEDSFLSANRQLPRKRRRLATEQTDPETPTQPPVCSSCGHVAGQVLFQGATEAMDTEPVEIATASPQHKAGQILESVWDVATKIATQMVAAQAARAERRAYACSTVQAELDHEPSQVQCTTASKQSDRQEGEGGTHTTGTQTDSRSPSVLSQGTQVYLPVLDRKMHSGRSFLGYRKDRGHLEQRVPDVLKPIKDPKVIRKPTRARGPVRGRAPRVAAAQQRVQRDEAWIWRSLGLLGMVFVAACLWGYLRDRHLWLDANRIPYGVLTQLRGDYRTGNQWVERVNFEIGKFLEIDWVSLG